VRVFDGDQGAGVVGDVSVESMGKRESTNGGRRRGGAMKVVQQIEAKVSVQVRMEDDGVIRGRIVGHMPYAATVETVTEEGAAAHVPQVSADVELLDDDRAAIGKVLAAIAEKYQGVLATKLNDARAEARRVAKAMGELV
jgi:hypothetical protein